MLKQQQLIKQLDQLVSFKTLTGDVVENRKALDYVLSLISSKAIINQTKNKETEILLASNVKTNSPDFGYMVHIDVVAASTKLFKMCQKEDILLGRGVSDMKFSIPLGIALLNELIEAKSKISFCLAITTDEEVGGFDGADFLANEMKWRPKTLIVPDGGDNFQFVEKAKGVCQLLVTSKGKATHASRPWEGRNALPSICKLASRLADQYKESNTTKGWSTTMNIGQLNGGISANQVCDKATLKLDFRFPENNSIAKIESEVRKLAQEIDPSLIIEKMSTGLPTFTDVNLNVVKDFLSSMEKEQGKKIKIRETFGASDARHFTKYKIPILMIKPTGGDIHAETEWLSISSTMKFYQGLRRFLKLKV